ncbi:MAG: cytochrome c peroxidase [Crocinitomicaceae bacterium]
MKFLYFTAFIFLAFRCAEKEDVTIEKLKVRDEIELGEELFFDPILSLDNSLACASCHQPQFAFADNKAFSLGVNDSVGTRNTPSVMNMLSRSFFFHDGRAASLEEQAIGPVENPLEMNLSFDEAVKRIKANPEYVRLFNKIYKEEPNAKNVANALSEFQRSLESDGSAPHDLFVNGVDLNAMTESQQRGRKLFLDDKSKCFDCHFGPDFTGDEFRNIGLYDGVKLLDKGRFDFTKKQEDIGGFKVPGLRNVALTAPYMHNGMFNSLEEVIDYYSNPYDFVKKPINMDTLMLKPLNFTQQEKTDLVNFLHSLTDKEIPYANRKVK